jgi:hypothetical protein
VIVVSAARLPAPPSKRSTQVRRKPRLFTKPPTQASPRLTGAPGQQRPSAAKRAYSALPACVVLHIDDHPVTQAQDMRPLVPGAIAFGPGDDDREAAVPLRDPINPQVAVPVPVAPLDR